MTDTQAAVAAALMQAAEVVYQFFDALSFDDEWSLEDLQAAILALITTDAMAALEAVKAEARKVKRPRFIENRYGDASSWAHEGEYGRYVYGIDFAGKAYSQTPNVTEMDHATIEAAEEFVVAEYRSTVSARILAALDKP